MNDKYVPGVCNIGPAKIAMRRRAGWIGFALTILAWAAFAHFDASPSWRLLLVLPASMLATGFLQAHFRFCAGYGMRGQFNFGPRIGKGEAVVQAESRKKDQEHARNIFIYSLVIGVIVAIVAYYA